MKFKVLIPIFCSILLGFLFGKIIFNEYNKNTINVFEEKERIYFVKINSYDIEDNIEIAENNYLVILENEIYNIYGGITKNKNIAEKVKECYNKTYKNVTIEERSVDNDSFLNILNEYDKIATIALSTDDLINIEKIIISNYKEMVLQQ